MTRCSGAGQALRARSQRRPARASRLFLIDGNSLAYRAYYALPEELATTDGFPTNALLGFANMLMRLLTDYHPEGVIVAWDTRPVHRLERFPGYKASRKPTPSLLKQQQPYLRPLVEAFGYRNVEHEGYEADDVIGTLSLRADEQGIATCVISHDRDAFQLVSDNVSVLLSPRGVTDVHVYTPERVEARYGIPPRLVPDFIGLKGDTSDDIAGRAGHRRQDGGRPARALRLARGHLRERGLPCRATSGARR